MCVTTPNEKNIYQKPMEELKSERPETKIQKHQSVIFCYLVSLIRLTPLLNTRFQQPWQLNYFKWNSRWQERRGGENKKKARLKEYQAGEQNLGSYEKH